MKAKLKNKNLGASLVEYALLLALIAVVCITALATVGDKANNKFQDIAKKLEARNISM